ncbi:serine protease Do [Modicisalibacter ilicicola DSM 19980]|uniref:Probable periplasmic serine endoprotease DegP-like n=1 Tax=Modicisalibacter ilicicola DSM 19980 TaxID=1121942 RepID=A0A1M5DA30_9GAMM|nr:DegQ family serine endoprotease [Halomonas ilicicola]SHF63532.1 serine protease Do [Halomonas ilicicola DSM 19980]
MQRITRYLSLWLMLMMMAFAAQAAQARELPDFTELVKQAAPGVVNISSTREVEQRAMPFGEFGGEEIPEFFRRFFEDQMPPGHGQGGPGRRQERQSLGSGFIISKDGYVLTNAHVVESADEIVVRLNDRRELDAELIGADAKTDVALLKIEGENLPTLELGDSEQLEVGEWVAAIGSPFGFDHSVTAGIVSAINRTLPSDAYVPFIQTDVAINPGNSGGPLFNLDGEVVGINSQIFTRSGGFMGLSFAIPINVAMDIADQLRADGRVSRGWLGVVIQPVSKDLAESFGLEGPQGALIAEVAPDAPAAKAGLKAGDIVLSVNGDEVDRSSTLPRLIGRVDPGSEVTLELMREGKRITKTVTVGDWPSDEMPMASAQDKDDSRTRLGVMVAPLAKEQLEELNLSSGVRVEQVAPGSVAASAGVRPGDIIVSLDQQDIDSGKRLSEVVSRIEGNRAVPLRLYRDGRSLFVALRLGDQED